MYVCNCPSVFPRFTLHNNDNLICFLLVLAEVLLKQRDWESKHCNYSSEATARSRVCEPCMGIFSILSKCLKPSITVIFVYYAWLIRKNRIQRVSTVFL